MRELYAKVSELLSRIDFEGIWHGFSQCAFALYDSNNVYLQNEVIPYDRRFLGNTSIEYNGECIAIWKIDDPIVEDLEILAADLVHEMFHAFQRKNHESRFPNDLLLLNYPDNVENFTVKYSENLLLVKAFTLEKMQEKKAYIMQFMAARKYREGLIGESIRQEYLSETIEGMAEYAGSIALKQLSRDKYEKRVAGYSKNLSTLDRRFFDIRKMLYYSGAVFCILLSESGLPFFHDIGNTELSLFDMAAAYATAEKPSIAYDNVLMPTEIEKYLFEKRRKFDDFLLSHHEEVMGNFFICGYDPMNMDKLGDMILCNHFIMLKTVRDDDPIFIQGPVIVHLKNGSVNEVISYIK